MSLKHFVNSLIGNLIKKEEPTIEKLSEKLSEKFSEETIKHKKLKKIKKRKKIREKTRKKNKVYRIKVKNFPYVYTRPYFENSDFIVIKEIEKDDLLVRELDFIIDSFFATDE